MLLHDEGMELKPYLDPKGKVTIGVGRCLETTGITAAEALSLLDNDILRARAAAATFSWFPKLDPVRQDVIVAMIFNLGLAGVCEFKGMITALSAQDYEKASSQMLNSLWSSQVGKRAVRLAQLMLSGQYPE